MTGRTFVGRARELRELREALALTRTRGELVLVSGEAGVGKTTLCRELIADASIVGTPAAWGQCRSDGARAYAPWIDALRSLGRSVAASAVERAVTLLSGRTTLDSTDRPADEEAERFALLDGVASALQAASEAHPTILVMDDLHEADIASLRVLEFLAPRLSSWNLLLLATLRDVEGDDAPERRALLDRIARFGRRLYLGTLDVQAIGELLALLSPGIATEPLATVLHQWTGGSPLFAQEMIRLLVAEHRLAGLATETAAGVQLPGGIRDLIRNRLERIPSVTRDLLAAASVLGPSFDVAPLAQMCRLSVADTLQALVPATAERMVEPDAGSTTRFAFRHGLLRAVLYQDQAPADRCARHARACEIFAPQLANDPDAILAEMTAHAERALPIGSVELALGLVLQAGHRALRLHADEEAAARFQRALELTRSLPHCSETARLEATLGLAEARTHLHGPDAAHEIFTQALDLAHRAGNGVGAARAVLGLTERGFGAPRPGTDAAMVAMVDEALAGLSPDAPNLRVQLLARLAAELCFDPDRERAPRLAQQAVDESRRRGDPATIVYALNVQYFLHWRRNEFLLCPELSREMLAIAERIAHRPMELQARVWRIHDAIVRGDIDAFEAGLAVYVPLAERIGQPRHRWYAAAYSSVLALWFGRWSEVETHAAEALQRAVGVADPAVSTIPLIQMTLARREQGNVADDEPRLRLAAEHFATSPIPRALLGLVLADLGRMAEASAELERLAADDFAALRRDYRVGVIAFLAELCGTLGDGRCAALLYEQLLPLQPFVLTMGGGAMVGAAAHHLGVLAAVRGDIARAQEHLGAAVALHRAMRGYPWLAKSLLAQASITSGDQLRALQLLDEAGSIARRLTMRPLLERIEAARLEVASRTPRRLTPEQRTVVPFAGRHRGGSTQRGTPVRPVADTVVATTASDESVLFRREGEYFTIGAAIDPFRLRASKGLEYIAQLLCHPGTAFHVTEVAAAVPVVAAHAVEATRGRSGVAVALSVRSGLGDAGEVLDGRARGAYRQRLAELREQLREAESWNDAGRRQRAEAEIALLTAELRRAVAPNGRTRRAAEHAERARVNVTRAIKTALRAIARHDRALSRYLSVTVKTGWFCQYVPEEGRAPRWDL